MLHALLLTAKRVSVRDKTNIGVSLRRYVKFSTACVPVPEMVLNYISSSLRTFLLSGAAMRLGMGTRQRKVAHRPRKDENIDLIGCIL